MVLHDEKIEALLKEGKLVKNPAKDILSQVNPNSLDLTISHSILRPKHNDTQIWYGALYNADLYWEKEDIPGIIQLAPGDCILASTQEYIVMPDSLYGQVFIKSSLGRLMVNHMMAGVIDAGFEGNITLELKNEGPHHIIIIPGQRVAQLVLFQMTDYAVYPYWAKDFSRYNGQEGPTPSRAERE